jgi:beta-alanine degradation protein BauB
MRALRLLTALSLAAMWHVSAAAQDPVKVDAAHYKVLVDNPSVRVLRISYAAGGKSTLHQHPDSVVIPLVASKVKFTGADGKAQERELAAESATFSPAETHNPENIGSGPVDAILVEFKTPAPGKATVPTDRPGLAIKVLAESPRAIAYRTIADAQFSEPAGTKHDYDQIVIALNAAQMSLALDGKPPKTTWARGDVQFIGRGTAHESKNTGGKPVEFIIVAVK